MGYRGRDEKKQVILTPEYLEARRGQNLQDYQARLSGIQAEIDAANEEFAAVKQKTAEQQQEHRDYLIAKTKEVQAEIDRLKAAQDAAARDHENKAAEIRGLIREQENLRQQTLAAERRIREEKQTNETYLSEIKDERAKLENKQIKLESDIRLNQRRLNEIEITYKKDEQLLVSLEDKRHELVQIQSRIDAGLESVENENKIRDNKIQEYNNVIKLYSDAIAKHEISAEQWQNFEKGKAEYEEWKKNKDKLEADLQAKDNRLNVLEKALRRKETDLNRREGIIKSLEQQQGGQDG